MSADLVLLEQRIIQRTGVIVIPTSWERIAPLILLADVVVLPTSYYSNFNYQPPKGRWANINLLNNGRVMQSEVMEYENQQMQFLDYGIRQDAEFLNCMEASILGQIAALGLVQTPPIVIDTTTSFQVFSSTYPDQFGDTFFITTYNDARIEFKLYSMPSYICSPSTIPGDLPPTPPPNEPLPPDAPNRDVEYPVSPPYIPPDDGGLTYTPPPAPSDAGIWSWTFKGASSATLFAGDAPGFSDDNPGILVEADGSCLDGNLYSIYSITRGVKYAPGSLALSTCGSGAMEILTQTFTPN